MRRIIFIFCFLYTHDITAQKHDYIWVAGYGSYPIKPNFGGIVLDFNEKEVETRLQYRVPDLSSVNTSICDSAGNLLFYSNGCGIYGSNDSLLQNGDNINPGDLHDKFCNDPYLAVYVSGKQSILALPFPGFPNQYIIFHTGVENVPTSSGGTTARATKYYYTRVDMNANGGQGTVIEKNTAFFQDTIAGKEMCAVKHSNGVDWWVFIPTRANKNEYYIIALTSVGPSQPMLQYFEFNTFSNFTQGQTLFTPDGNKFIRYRSNEGIYIFDFDRETGTLSNMVFVNPPEITLKYGGCAVSPNSRFLYLTNLTKVFQLDLADPLNPAAVQVVATYDGYADPLAANFGYCQLGPDCKIYIGTGNTTRVMHVIHNPDEPGMACNLEQHGLHLPAYSDGIPYFPNFRLGPPDNPGLPCSPVVSTTNPPTPLPAFSVFPNPVSTLLQVVPNRQYHGPARLRLHDLTGRLALERVFDPLASSTEVDVSTLPVGVYVYEVWCEGRVQRVGKVVKIE